MSVDDSISKTRSAGDPSAGMPSEGVIPATLSKRTFPPTAPPAARWKYHFWILVVALSLLTIAFLLNVAGQGTTTSLPLIGEIPQLCTWKRLVGIDCPGCGLTRSIVALAHGQWATAWRFNPAGWLFFAVCLYQIPFRSLQLWRLYHDRADYRHRLVVINIAVWTLVLTMIVQWIWKLGIWKLGI